MSVVPPDLEGANLTQGTARISVKSGHCAPFVKYALQSPQVSRHIERIAKGSTFREISIDQLRKTEILLPPLEEQSRIAAVLATWDRAEASMEMILRAKRRLKRALLQQLLTGKRRFSYFSAVAERKDTPFGSIPADWPVVRIGKLFRQIQRKNSEGVARVLTASGRHGLVDQREYFNRSVAGKSLADYYLLRQGEFAYNRSTMNGYPYGAIKRLDRYEEGVVSTLYLCFALTSEDCDSDYFAHLFESGLLNRQLRGIAQVGARAHGLLNVSASDFFDLLVPVPSYAEQRRIAQVLSALDREIDLLNEQLRCLKDHKRGLMQKLLTGQVRVKV